MGCSMETEIPPYEVDELIRRHSQTYRKAVLAFLLSYLQVGEKFTLAQMTEVLVKHGYDVRRLPWWTQSRLLRCKHFKKMENATWQRVR